MPVSNSPMRVCKFAYRAAMLHKVNYIAQEGMANGYVAICGSVFIVRPSVILSSSSLLR